MEYILLDLYFFVIFYKISLNEYMFVILNVVKCLEFKVLVSILGVMYFLVFIFVFGLFVLILLVFNECLIESLKFVI